MGCPTHLRYTKEHEWIAVDGAIGTVGITDYAQSTLGDIVFVDLPKVGDRVTAHQTFGSVESVKAVSDLYSPVSGTVKEINPELAATPDKVNEDAYAAWMIKVELADAAEQATLLTAAEYDAFIAEETGK